MRQDAVAADAAHAMTTSLRYLQRAGRFGRELRSDDSQAQSGAAGRRFELAGYAVDADAVAAAIVSRLQAGGTLPRPPGSG